MRRLETCPRCGTPRTPENVYRRRCVECHRRGARMRAKFGGKPTCEVCHHALADHDATDGGRCYHADASGNYVCECSRPELDVTSPRVAVRSAYHEERA